MQNKKFYDLVVIGSGPGGYVSAIKASHLGMKVAIVEKDALGGICLNWGCIPTKTLLKIAEVLEYIKKASTFCINVEKFSYDFNAIINRSRQIAERLSKGVEFLMKKNGIEVFWGKGKILSPSKVFIQGKENLTIETKNIIIATGTSPKPLDFLPFDGEKFLSYKDALKMSQKPESLAIIGGGAIGIEFAYFYNALGIPVTLIEILPNLLPIADREISLELEKAFAKKGIKVFINSKISEAVPSGKEISLKIERKGKFEYLNVEKVLLAVGVMPNTRDLWAENLDIKLNPKGFILVNENYETSFPGIYAIGDCIGPPLLAHSASQEGIRAVYAISGSPIPPVDPLKVPLCIYSQPQVAWVGYTEEQLKEENIPYKLGKFPYKPNGKALAMGEVEGFVKVLIGEKYGELLGCHIIGAEATEMITEWALGMESEITYNEVLSTIHPHPTLHEMIWESVEAALGKPIHL